MPERDAAVMNSLKELSIASDLDESALTEILGKLTPSEKQALLDLDPELGFSDDKIKPYILILNSLSEKERFVLMQY